MEENESVLVIADEESQPFYKTLRIGQAPVTTASPEQAIASLRKGGVGLIILDSSHDAERGLSILSGLKQEFASVPIIFLADRVSDEMVVRVFRTGARNYFSKPAPLSEIEQNAIALLKLRRCCNETRESLRAGDLGEGDTRDPRLRPPVPLGLDRAICCMYEHLAGDLSLDEVAKEAGMSKYHFCRVFKLHWGMSPMRFLCGLRVEQAKQLLKRQDLKVSSVAFSVGFNDIGEFNRQFKKVTGTSPSKYRTLHVKTDYGGFLSPLMAECEAESRSGPPPAP